MDVATIDWNDSKFEKDDIYEHINAPQWIDFNANHNPYLQHDDSWFCTPECNHPKTADDFFLKRMPNRCKPQRSANVSENTPPADCSMRNSIVKKRGTPMNKIMSTKNVQDSENRNPNSVTPDHNIKSSTEKKKENDGSSLCQENDGSSLCQETRRKLRSTFSARNLFAGNSVLNQITEFCNELKRLATRKKEEVEQMEPEVGVLQEREVQKMPLLETTKLKYELSNNSSRNGKEKKLARKKRNDGLQNSPIEENTKSRSGKNKEIVSQIGTIKATPPEAFRPRPEK
nr:hypothetical protein [Tanacetum cinerariifolium]